MVEATGELGMLGAHAVERLAREDLHRGGLGRNDARAAWLARIKRELAGDRASPQLGEPQRVATFTALHHVEAAALDEEDLLGTVAFPAKRLPERDLAPHQVRREQAQLRGAGQEREGGAVAGGLAMPLEQRFLRSLQRLVERVVQGQAAALGSLRQRT